MSASHSTWKAAAASSVGVGSSAGGDVGVGAGVDVGSAWPHAARTNAIANAISASRTTLLAPIPVVLMAVPFLCSRSPTIALRLWAPRGFALTGSIFPGIECGFKIREAALDAGKCTVDRV